MNEKVVTPKSFVAGDFLVPEDDLGPNKIFTAIKILAVDDKGYKCKRINLMYNGEEFFMSKDAMNKTHWVAVENSVQLPLL
jgi:hypothetical protein